MMLDIIFASVLIISCVAFLGFLWRISGSTKTRRKRTKKTKPKQKDKAKRKEIDGVEIPKEWQTNKPNVKSNPSPSLFEKSSSHKIRVPGLLTMKRVIAGVLLIFNFFIAQATLTSAPATQPLYILFILNAFILIDYLWKTRRKETI